METERKAISYLLFVASIIGLAIFIYATVSFKPHDYFYIDGVPKDPFTVINVVSRWANFSFVTYLSLIIFSVYGIMNFIAEITHCEKLLRITQNDYLVLFICVNQIFVLLGYTFFQLAFNGDFGYYAHSLAGAISLVTNLIVHYVITSVAIIWFFVRKFGKIKFGKCFFFLIFYLVYGLAVKFTGMYCYSFEWYPYPIFSSRHLWYYMFGSLNNYNPILATSLVIIFIILILIAYMFLTYVCTLYINKKAKKGAE